MKRIISLFLSVIIVITLVAQTGINTFAAGNSLRAATSISLNTTYNGNINSGNLYDWYKFTLSSSGKVNFIAQNYTSGGGAFFNVYNSSGEEVDEFSGTYDDNFGYVRTNKTYYFLAGVYYLRVNDGDYSRQFGNYSVTVNYQSGNESFAENQNNNNDLIGSANTISLNTKYKGVICFNEAYDFYKFNMTSAGTLSLIANVYSNQKSAYISIFDSEGNELDSFSESYNTNLGYVPLNKTINLSKGTFYLRINDGFYENQCGFYNFELKYSIYIPSPTGFKCTARTASAEKVAWNKVAGVTGYQVQCSDGGSNWAQNKVTSGNSAVFSGLVAGGKYKFRVRAYKRINGVNYFSAWSPTLNSCAKPATVTLKGVSSPKHTQIKTIWAKAGGVVTGYQIVYSRNKAFTNIAARKNVTGKSTVTYTGKNFTKGRTYYIAVRAYTVFAGQVYYGKYSAIKAVKCK